LTCGVVIADVVSICRKVSNSPNADCLLEVIKRKGVFEPPRPANVNKQSSAEFSDEYGYVVIYAATSQDCKIPLAGGTVKFAWVKWRCLNRRRRCTNNCWNWPKL